MNSTNQENNMNTATLRALGYDAARAGNVAEAARLYQAALEAYPVKVGALAKKDMLALRILVSTYTQAADSAFNRTEGNQMTRN